MNILDKRHCKSSVFFVAKIKGVNRVGEIKSSGRDSCCSYNGSFYVFDWLCCVCCQFHRLWIHDKFFLYHHTANNSVLYFYHLVFSPFDFSDAIGR